MYPPIVSQGLFITFEGTEGAGKTTQIARLAARLEKAGHSVVALREPGGTPLCEEIRHLLKHHPSGQGMTGETELLLMSASRAQLVREVIRPALAAGKVVLCDRFYDSTVVYQGYGRGLDHEWVASMIDFAVGPTRPELTLLLRVPLAISEARRASRKGETLPDRFDDAGKAFFQRVELAYSELVETESDRVREIDATQPIEAVEEAIWKWIVPFVENRELAGSTSHKSAGEWTHSKLAESPKLA